jgi:tetratricopeptide (TPR) repeat protein
MRAGPGRLGGRERGALLAAAALLACLALSAGVLRALEATGRAAGRAPAGELELLPAPGLARALAFSYEAVLADLFWVRTILYFGRHVEGDRQFPKLAALLDLVVGLDPHFLEAYRTGALFLSFFARDFPAAVRLLERGAQANPGRWEIPHDLASLYLLFAGDPAQAMTWFLRADGLPGRPDYVPRLAARLAARAGHREVAIELWLRVLEQTPNAYIRGQAEEELRALGVPAGGGEPGRGAGRREGRHAGA